MINATTKRKGKSEKLKASSLLRPKDIQSFVEQLVEDDFHAKQVLSISHAVIGVIHGATLGIHAIGQGMAQARGLNPKHAIKQADRLLSNGKIIIDDFFTQWVPYILGQREEVVVAIDWTEFDADDHSTIALYLITSHGRATPLVWKTVTKSTIEGWRNEHEDNLLELFAKLRPVNVSGGPEGASGHQAVRQTLFHRGNLSRYQGCPFRNGTQSHPHREPGSP